MDSGRRGRRRRRRGGSGRVGRTAAATPREGPILKRPSSKRLRRLPTRSRSCGRPGRHPLKRRSGEPPPTPRRLLNAPRRSPREKRRAPCPRRATLRRRLRRRRARGGPGPYRRRGSGSAGRGLLAPGGQTQPPLKLRRPSNPRGPSTARSAFFWKSSPWRDPNSSPPAARAAPRSPRPARRRHASAPPSPGTRRTPTTPSTGTTARDHRES
mmetsp:Transcript_7908/g.25963  ORF Transcript_7908/g.25963 Transcript_7908/m.25963 type:complete len:212 (+) Transcript_7908:237-872(+)